ncbi:MAG: L,D-transpeptidase family protein [Ferruginibacter sp.]|nr:L,D-transpeptidase family protein [Ferruginibacter sp.]
MRFHFFICSVCLMLCFSCKNAQRGAAHAGDKPAVLIDPTIQGNFSTQADQVFDSLAIQKFIDSFPQFNLLQQDLRTFYKNRGYAFAWFDKEGMIEQAGNLFNRIKNIEEEGLATKKLQYTAQFSTMMDSSTVLRSGPQLPLELMLTAQYLQYSKLVWEGMDEEQSKALEWLLPRKKISTGQLLDSLLSGKDVLANPPVYRQYYLLKEYLKKYRALLTDSSRIEFTKDLKLGDSSTQVKQVRKKLFLYGDIALDNSGEKFDQELKTAVGNFQSRMGLKSSGIINAGFLKELNVPVSDRIQSVIINMERSRWVTDSMHGNYLVINIPEYKLHVYENDSLAWDMNVVVGQNQHKTVVFNGDMKYIVFSPYWNIPAGILKNETLPAIKRNPNYLASHNMEWNNGSVRQKPGPNNSLGLVKFLFPNSHSIYLHDSPAKSLFNETNRAFSHGCIRLAEPKKLAEYLLRNDTSWNTEKIMAAMNSGTEKYVTLKKTVPVFIAYFTAWVDKNSKLNFRPDVYARDKRLADMILQSN